MAEVINLCPHEVTLVVGDRTISIPPSGVVPRLDEKTVPTIPVVIDGVAIPVVKVEFGDVVGVDPAALPVDAVLIAGPLIAEQLARHLGRTVYAPDTGPNSAVRDNAGRIVAVRRLRVYHP